MSNAHFFTYTVFHTFLLHALTFAAEILYTIILYAHQIEFTCPHRASFFEGITYHVDLKFGISLHFPQLHMHESSFLVKYKYFSLKIF